MDKSWIIMPRNSAVYVEGVKGFIQFALENRSIEETIICPCSLCGFRKWQTGDVVYDHLICTPFPKGYTLWDFHGESDIGETSNVPVRNVVDVVQELPVDVDPIQNMLNDAFGVNTQNQNLLEPEEVNRSGGGTVPNANVNGHEGTEFYDLAKDGEQPLYEGCKKYSKLSFLVKLYHIKCICGMTDKAMTMILELLQDAFEHAKILTSFYDAKKIITKLGLDYQKIHACPNNCMIFWGEDDENRQNCKVCNKSRCKEKDKATENSALNVSKKKKKVPAKVVRYFPLKPRLQRLFLSEKTAEDMRWHVTNINNDGLLRHPRDGEAWKRFDSMYTDFALEPRNVRLGLATDGFNPYGSLNASYSIWPVILISYNTPPWLVMKSTSFILSTLIPGKQMPGNDIDVYLQPLIKELKELWHDGVHTYDASRQQMFKMHASLMWTISDFPGLGALSGWNTYTSLACPVCNFDSIPCRLRYSQKYCFMGHRRFLERRHKFRLQKIRFNGEQEMRNPPKKLSGSDILEQVCDVNVTFGRKPKDGKKGKRRRGNQNVAAGGTQQWKKKSIFFELPYWEYNLLRHNLDVMHIEKNVCDNVVYTLLNDSSKSKDHLKVRKDLQEIGCKPDLWPDENGKYPLAIYTLIKEGKKAFLSTLKNITVPDGHSSDISRCIDIEHLRLNGMLKSHDCHMLMEQFLPLAMRVSLPEEVSKVLIELCSFLKKICGKALSIPDLNKLQDDIVVTLCHMEMLFPPSFFTVMVHLLVHLVDEVKLGGPVQYRWMYPIERYLGDLKSFVRNKARPEGSIAEGYLMQEILTFCSRYLDNIETRWNRLNRVDDVPNEKPSPSRIDDLFPQVGKPVGGYTYITLIETEKLQAHRHVLTNCSAVDSYIKEFRTFAQRQVRIRGRNTNAVDMKVHREFAGWFSNVIHRDLDKVPEEDKTVMLCLAQGPISQARRFSAYNVNGFKFRTVDRERGLKTQNSGVFGTFGTRSYSSSSDGNMQFGGVPYYGKLVDIVEISYNGVFSVTLFKCEWANTPNPRCIKTDKLGFTSINFARPIHTGQFEDDEPYIKAVEAVLVYFVDDDKDKGWTIPVHVKPRDLYEMGGDDDQHFGSIEEFPSQNLEQLFPDVDTHIRLATTDLVDGRTSSVLNENENDDMEVS